LTAARKGYHEMNNCLRPFLEEYICELLIEVLNRTGLPVSGAEYCDRYVAELDPIAETHKATYVIEEEGMSLLLSCEPTTILDQADVIDHLISEVLRVNAEFGLENVCVTSSLVFTDIRSYFARSPALRERQSESTPDPPGTDGYSKDTTGVVM
jgi:hypothetical protein